MLSKQHRTNIVLDEEIVQEALKLSNIKTKRALIDAAIRAYISVLKNKPTSNQSLLDLQGCKPFFDDYDYKALRRRNVPKISE